MNQGQDPKPTVVFSGKIWEANLVKNLLENSGIPAFLKDEFVGTIAPWYIAPGGVGSVKVVVAEKHVAEAQSIIKSMNSNQTEIN